MSPADSAGSADGRMAESTDVFERHRRLLFSVSYDMLGSVADAEDCLQEAWLRWAREDRSDVANPRSYLVRVVTNVTLNRLRVLRNRRETYVGPWLPEPMLTERFLAASLEGDLDGLKAMLTEDAVVLTDGGGQVKAALRPVYGAERAAWLLCGGSGPRGLPDRALRLDFLPTTKSRGIPTDEVGRIGTTSRVPAGSCFTDRPTARVSTG